MIIGLQGQSSYRIFYKVDSKPNIEKDSITTDIYLLDVYPKERLSIFYNNAYYDLDSIEASLKIIANAAGAVRFDFNKLKSMHWNKGVLLKNDEMSAIENFDGDSFKYSENVSINWNILNDKKKCGDYDCQKASGNFRGRNWEAWFTTDIPLNIFPYKFAGLPGLVYEIDDSTNSYRFIFIGLKKINDNPFYPSVFSKAVSTSKKNYLKAFSNYKKDPSKKLKDGFLVTDSGETMEIFGGFSKKFIAERTNEIKKQLSENNNPIELEYPVMKKIISDILYYLLILFMSYIFANKALNVDAFQMNIFKTGIFGEKLSNLLAYFVLIIDQLYCC